jgi:hypothetical protein
MTTGVDASRGRRRRRVLMGGGPRDDAGRCLRQHHGAVHVLPGLLELLPLTVVTDLLPSLTGVDRHGLARPGPSGARVVAARVDPSVIPVPPASPEIEGTTAMARHAPDCPEFDQ